MAVRDNAQEVRFLFAVHKKPDMGGAVSPPVVL